MMNPNHPDDERLAAFAGADPETTGDASLSEHLASCERCATTVAELRSLRTALAELPDLAPHRPLRLLPPAAAARPGLADRIGGVIRGIFAPALTAGAALALVGAVGTFAPSAAPAGGAPDALSELAAQASAAGEGAGAAEASDGSSLFGTAASSSDGATNEADHEGAESTVTDAAAPTESPLFVGQQRAVESMAGADQSEGPASVEMTDRPIWPMVLFTGVALIVVMVLLRWILVPRTT